MLKQRVITALVLVAVFLAALFFLPAVWFAGFVAAIILVASWEWANLSGFESPLSRLFYILLTAAGVAAAAVYINLLPSLDASAVDSGAVFNLLLAGCLWWAVALLLVQGYPSSQILWGSRSLRAVMGLLVLLPAWVGFSWVRLHPQGEWLILLIVAVVACADIGGYFTGRRWGRRKLKPAVSPGKTWEGFFGGLFANIIFAVALWFIVGGNLWLWLAIIIPTSLISVLGDLLESMVKRHRGIKDSSQLLPGHGGVLDRADSLTAAAPVFALALYASGMGV
ncbi:phosphatidate cytidylyltransferase [Cellvibrio polysaccharolyticus]|uniref:Phosphatidate cytidylyltransferase n=1 Tax=Cellvibrio polysaccharolyticus TaxID=2082724 RepID=A0A928V5G2_9GAMM|nr:phosphatidate cytidylyltransferase [Cellvibrio polysaccharolyticus]MBE8716934.1 phosphatidate cytidylyltransferase [Cellvibrio polysaccharolyticus]